MSARGRWVVLAVLLAGLCSSSIFAEGRDYNPKKGLGQRYLTGGEFDGQNLDFSPDGRLVVYVRLGRSSDIWITDLEGNQKAVTSTPFWETRPFFAPSGDEIVFWSDRETDVGEPYSVLTTGGAAKRLLPNVSHCREVKFAPDGASLAFVQGTSKSDVLCWRAIDSNDEWNVRVTGEGIHSVMFPPEGGRLFATAAQFDAIQRRKYWSAIRLSNKAPSQVEYLLTDSNPVSTVGWANERLLLRRETGIAYTPSYCLLSEDAATSTSIALTIRHGASKTIISKGGDAFIYDSDKASPYDYDLYRYDIQTGEDRRLTHESGLLPSFTVSPDERQLVYLLGKRHFFARHPMSRGELICLDIATGARKTLGEND
ncbi:hypothetical protein KQI84_17090 [bacterium]|nr:hypothetical protein [bacterium]